MHASTYLHGISVRDDGRADCACPATYYLQGKKTKLGSGWIKWDGWNGWTYVDVAVGVFLERMKWRILCLDAVPTGSGLSSFSLQPVD